MILYVIIQLIHFLSIKIMRFKNLKISVIAPMYNEEMIIHTFIEKVIPVLDENFSDYELILVDDGSSDLTVERTLPYVSSNPHIRLITFSRNYGHEIASTAGLDHADGDYVILMDSDLQHPPEVIPDLMQKALDGYDVVTASRTNREHESWIKKNMAHIFYRFARKMTGFDLSADTGNFRIMSKQVVNSLKQMRENDRHLIMMFAYMGFKSATVPYTCLPRTAGESKYSLLTLINLSLDSIIGFSARPLRIMSAISIFVSVVMMGYAGFILIQKLFTHQQLADGIASVIFLTSGLFSILFLFLAIISEYISRIHVESKNRPLYNIKQELTHETFKKND